MERKITLFEIFTLIIGSIPVYFLFKTSPSEVVLPALITFGIILFLIFLGSILLSIPKKYRELKQLLTSTQQEVFEIKRDLNFKKQFDTMDLRVKIVEQSLSKKGEIDPRIILGVSLVILLLLFLRFMNII
ncbi:MAG: hypothetical protein WC595_04280 [Candidatus Nanoarchaeia archaeon]